MLSTFCNSSNVTFALTREGSLKIKNEYWENNETCERRGGGKIGKEGEGRGEYQGCLLSSSRSIPLYW